MQTKFEHFAATNLLGGKQSPPRNNGKLYFDAEWEQRAFGLALALAKAGYFEWEDFQQSLIQAISDWEAEHELDDQSWDYYERWLLALERVVRASGLVDAPEVADRVAAMRLGPQLDASSGVPLDRTETSSEQKANT